VMAYRGGNDDRRHAERIYESYVDAMTGFVRWLVEHGHSVRLFTGDRVDDEVVEAITAAVPGPVTRAQVSSLDDLLGQLAAVETVVATRYHNVLCALKVATPTLSVGYAAKNDVLMAEFGVGEFCELERESARVRELLVARNAAVTRQVADQLGALSTVLEAR